jgi:allophanate hydrolase subunit 2
VVASVSLDLLAQKRPGDLVRFEITTVPQAVTLLRDEAQRLQRARDLFRAALVALGRQDVLATGDRR